MTPITETEWLTTEELAGVFKVSPDTIRDWRKKGTGPRAMKVGHAVRYARPDVQSWLAQRNGLTA
jgi:excisionase family DNA binding protein